MTPLQKLLNQLIDDSMNEVAFQHNVYNRSDVEQATINIVADVEPESVRVIRRHHDKKEKNDQRYIYVYEG